ncbi:MAG: RsmD family RNA methyltransferase [Bacteroidota bacterium]|nr:RsmD family RNA methyltransferase [Bacteroidota bacterium]
MRIISGKNKGRVIKAPNSLPVRPTTDMAKEAIFNILENRYFLEQKKVLDLFTGTGNIAFEFASRGAKDIIAIDQHLHCCNFITKTATELDYKIDIRKMDCLDFLERTNATFDIIFADPPYKFELYEKLKDIILNKELVNKDGCLIIEHNENTKFDKENVELRKYGSVHFSIFTT